MWDLEDQISLDNQVFGEVEGISGSSVVVLLVIEVTGLRIQITEVVLDMDRVFPHPHKISHVSPHPNDDNPLKLDNDDDDTESLPSDKGTTQGYHHQPPLATSLRL
ncbi:hypothetical protein ACOMHN_049141 [Nucella lapillus]